MKMSSSFDLFILYNYCYYFKVKTCLRKFRTYLTRFKGFRHVPSTNYVQLPTYFISLKPHFLLIVGKLKYIEGVDAVINLNDILTPM